MVVRCDAMRRVSVVKQQDETEGGGGALSLLQCWPRVLAGERMRPPRNWDLDWSSRGEEAGKEWLVGRGSGAHLLTVQFRSG